MRLAVLILLAAPASAHVGDLVGGIDVVPAIDGGEAVEIEANYGLVLRDGDSWAWVCHEAVTSPGAIRAPRYVRSTGGTWLATVSDFTQGRDGKTLFRSTDGGCTWSDVAGADGHLVAAAAFDPGDPSAAWAVTAEGSILGSTDGGATWVEDTATPGRVFYGLASGGHAMFATATDLGGTRGFLWRRPAGGAWSEVDVPLPAGTEGGRLRLLETGGAERAWVVVDPLGDDTLLETTDAGASWTEVLVADGEIVDGAADSTGLWLALNGLDLVRVEGGTVSAPVADFPFSVAVGTVGETLYLAPQSYLVGPLLSRSTGEVFETLAFPDDIAAPLDCPAGSHVAEICAPLWDDLLPRIRGFDAPLIETAGDTGDDEPEPSEPDPEDKEGCGCATGTPAGGPLVLALLLWRRRR